MVIDLELARRFVFFRKRYIGSQAKAAVICECSQKNISEIERGLTSISLEVMYHLYTKERLNSDWFLTGIGSPKRVDKPKENLISTVQDLQADLDFTHAGIRRLDYLLTKIYNDYYGGEMPKPGNYNIKNVQKTSKKNEKTR